MFATKPDMLLALDRRLQGAAAPSAGRTGALGSGSVRLLQLTTTPAPGPGGILSPAAMAYAEMAEDAARRGVRLIPEE